MKKKIVEYLIFVLSIISIVLIVHFINIITISELTAIPFGTWIIQFAVCLCIIRILGNFIFK